MTLVSRTLSYLQERRDKLLGGGINSIPSPFNRFSSEFIGIEQGKYVVITSTTKGGKTQFTSFTFLYTPLLYAYNNPDKLRVKFFYYSLEETPEDVTKRFMSFLLNKLSHGKTRISPTDLQSSHNSSPLSQEVLDTLSSGEYAEILKFFEEHVEFSPSRNPTGVYNEVRKYMEEHGTVHTKKKKVKGDLGEAIEIDAFDYYEPDDPDEYVFIIFDHLSLVQSEKGMTLKQTADKLSEYFVILRNRYKVSPILIQQQAFDGESLDAFKANKLRPTAQGLADSKYTARDCNLLLGLFSPFKHELPEYKRYDITIFRDNIRFLEVVLNRGGSVGGLVALFFDGATCDFIELPTSDNKVELLKVYDYMKSIRTSTYSAKSICMMAISRTINYLREWNFSFIFAGLKENKNG